MPELIGFLIVFAVLAAIVAFLAQGVARIVGFVILAALAVIIGTPTVREGLPELSNFFGQGSENQTQIQAAPNTVPGETNNPDTQDGTTTDTNPNDGTDSGSTTGGGGGGSTTTGGTTSPRPARTPQPALW